MADTSAVEAPAGYRLGDPIALTDLLALPPDGRRYARDPAGRLSLRSPDHARRHRSPISRLVAALVRRVPATWEVAPEPGIALPILIHLRGGRLPASSLGPQAIEPDVAVFSTTLEDDVAHFGVSDLRLVVEVLSTSTWRADLGLGEADQVDRWRSYLASGVPELWVINVGVEDARLPTGSGLFLRNAGEAWQPLEGRDLVVGPPVVHGLGAVTGGIARSNTLEGEVDVGALLAAL